MGGGLIHLAEARKSGRRCRRAGQLEDVANASHKMLTRE